MMGKAKNKIRKKRCGRSKRKQRDSAIESAAVALTMVPYAEFYEKIRAGEKMEKELKQKEKIEKRKSWLDN